MAGSCDVTTITSQRASRFFAIAAGSSSALLLAPLAISGSAYAFPGALASILFAPTLAGWLGRALFARHPSRWGATWRGALISLVTLAATNLFYWGLIYITIGERTKEAMLIAAIGTVLFSWYALLFGVTTGWLVIRRSAETRLAASTGT